MPGRSDSGGLLGGGPLCLPLHLLLALWRWVGDLSQEGMFWWGEGQAAGDAAGRPGHSQGLRDPVWTLGCRRLDGEKQTLETPRSAPSLGAVEA